MRTADHTETELLNKLAERLKEITQRERIVIKLPFGKDLTRVEFYCSETEPNRGSAGQVFSGKQFDGILKISAYAEYNNKATNTTSYTYERELMSHLNSIVSNIYKIANK